LLVIRQVDYQNGAEPSRAGTNGEAATRAGTLQGAAAAGGNGVSHDKRALLKVPPSRRAAPRELRRVAPGVPRALSFAQERLFVLHELAPGLVAYNTPIVLRLRGSLDIAALRRTCDELLRRHEVLRTTVRLDGDDLRVEVLEDVAVPFSLTVLPDALSEEGIRAAVEGEVRRPFDLGRDVLLRAQLFRVADDDHVVVLASHHIASDEVSKRILTKELSALYASFVNDEPSPLPGPALGYADYAAWQRDEAAGGRLADGLAWWRGTMSSAPEAIDLPVDRPRPPRESFQGAKYRSLLSPGTLAALKAIARQEKATLFMVLLGAFSGILERYCGQGDVVVGSPVSGRNRPELSDMVGLFLNTLPLRVRTSGDPSFAELVRRARAAAVGAFSHQEVPFEQIVEALHPGRDLSRNPLFQVMLTLRGRATTPPELAGLQAEPFGFEGGWSKFDIAAVCSESERGLEILWQYATDLFDASTIEAMARHLEALVRAGTEAPEVALSALPLMGSEERSLVVETWNQTEAAFPDACVHDLVGAQAAATPERLAVGDSKGWLTYRQLDERANRLAHHLQGLGAGPDVVVAVCVERSVDMEVAVLAVLKAGAAYLPLDPGYPTDRLSFMLADSQAAVLVAGSGLAGRLPAHPVTVLVDHVELAHLPASAPLSAVSPSNLAYVIYTSGSTGKPKGVMVEHRGVVNRLAWMQEAYHLVEADTVLQKTPLSFDVSAWEVLWPVMTGARLFMARPDGHRDATYLAQVLADQAISVAHFVPSMLSVFLDAGGAERASALRLVVCSGEALADQLKERFFEHFPAVELANLYGPTEASIDVTYERCRPGQPVTIGRPIANTQAYVLDDHGAPLPPGAPGELYLGGVGLARGYLGRPELTAERFPPSPFRPGERLYRTGDRARARPDGRLEYLGRLDDQVKLHGLRIELGEVEAVLAEHGPVKEVAVVMREDSPGGSRLVAYVTPATTDLASLGAHARRYLPGYMVPSQVVALDELPRTPSGKTDRRALPPPGAPAGNASVAPGTPLEKRVADPRGHQGGAHEAPRNPTEERLAAIFAELLGLDEVGVDDDFFALGGHSLLANQVVVRARRELDIALPVHALFVAPTVATLAAEVEAERAATAAVDEELEAIVVALAALSEEEAATLMAETRDEEDH